MSAATAGGADQRRELVLPRPGHRLHGLRRRRRHRPHLPLRPRPADRAAPTSGRRSSAGLVQRLRALNLFLADIYHEPGHPRGRRRPAPSSSSARGNFRREMIGLDVPGGVYAHVGGVDLVRDGDGRYLVLEDNLRTPSGVSYMLESREALKRIFAAALRPLRRPADRPVPARACSRRCGRSPGARRRRPERSCCSRPGAYNSAYFEHSFLARQMGIELVEGRDLVVHRNRVFIRTTRGLRARRRRSTAGSTTTSSTRSRSGRTALLGVAGLLNAYRAGQRDARERDRHRRRRRQGDLPVRPGHDPLLPRRGADPRERPDLPRDGRRPTARTCSTTSTSWS